jgi:hypothetical protein
MEARGFARRTQHGLWLAASLSAVLCLGDVTVDDFSSIAAWRPNPDGGNPPQILQDAQGVSGPCLRLVYRDAEPHWGNITRDVSMPPEATGLSFRVRVSAATAEAALHVWLFEADGDAYVVRVQPEGKELYALGEGWHTATVPFSTLRYDPRGDKKRSFLSINRLLLGCNFGDFEIAVDDLAWAMQPQGSVALPRSAPAQWARGPAGAVAILAEPTFPARPSQARPERLAGLLREAGFGVTLLRAGDVCDPAVLRQSAVDVLVVPCSPLYPREGRDALLAFLREGGAFVALGGYAFDELVVLSATGWVRVDPAVTATAMDAHTQPTTGFNTRSGKPGDTMGLNPDQLGVFDPSYELRRTASLKASPEQHLLAPEWTAGTVVQGFAAVAMTGSNSPVFPDVHGRWTPLAEAVDRFGRSRGPVLALVQNYAGPYARAGWAFAGVTDQDLFDGRFPALDQALVAVSRRLAAPAFLHSLRTNLACYRQGETVTVSVHTRLAAALAGTVHLEIDGQRLASLPAAAGEQVLSTTWEPGAFARDLCQVRALLEVEGRTVDEMTTAISVWDDGVVRSGPTISQRDNHFEFRGQPTFLCGANQTGMMWYSANEDPRVWQRDFETMGDHGLNILRILHFSPFAKEGEAAKSSRDPLDLRQQPVSTQRQTDAMVQLAQQNNVAIFLTLHDWMGVELSDEELEAQRQWAEFWAGRYRDVPGIFYDIQNEPSVGIPDNAGTRALLEAWLSRRYGDLDAARTAWGCPAGQPLPLAFDRNAPWDSLQARDLDRFRAELFVRWTAANAAGVRAGDPEALVTVGYLQTQTAADKFVGAAGLDFTNTHFYGSIPEYRAILKLTDRRFEGKSFSLGEFGAREAHDARVNGQTGDPAHISVPYYLAVGHYALGMGAAFVACWDWKDFRDCVFPWGITHADLVPKPVLEAYRNQALLFRTARPRYQPPAVYLLVPDSHRFGAKTDTLHGGLVRAVNWLLGCNAAFAVINEESLAALPTSCRALVWPFPYCPTDESFAQVRRFVEAGGALLLTGDVRFAADRKPTRPGRLQELGFVAPGETRPPLPVDGSLSRDALTASCGRGTVTWVPCPLELDGNPVGGAVYRAFLDRAGIARLRLDPDDGSVHAFEVPLHAGAALVFYNDTAARRKVTVEGSSLANRIEIELDSRSTGFVLADAGRVQAAEAQGQVIVDGRVVLETEGPLAVVALDNADLGASTVRLVLPFGPGKAALAAAGQPLAIETGAFRAGRWQTLASEGSAAAGPCLLTIDAGAPFDLRLVAPPAGLPAARQAAERLLNRQP